MEHNKSSKKFGRKKKKKKVGLTHRNTRVGRFSCCWILSIISWNQWETSTTEQNDRRDDILHLCFCLVTSSIYHSVSGFVFVFDQFDPWTSNILEMETMGCSFKQQHKKSTAKEYSPEAIKRPCYGNHRRIHTS